VSVRFERGRVRWFVVYFQPPEPGAATFTGAVRHRGERIDPAALVGPAAVIARFGEPVAIETIRAYGSVTHFALSYDADGAEWEVLLTTDGRVAEIGVHGIG
jgi:hypothetical protein